MGINKRTLVLSSSQLIDLISETVILVEQKKKASCKKFSKTEYGTGNLIADANDIQEFLINKGYKIKKDFDFGNDTAQAVGEYLGYPGITTRANLVNHMYKLYPKAFGTPDSPETFGLGPLAQGVIADLLYDECINDKIHSDEEELEYLDKLSEKYGYDVTIYGTPNTKRGYDEKNGTRGDGLSNYQKPIKEKFKKLVPDRSGVDYKTAKKWVPDKEAYHEALGRYYGIQRVMNDNMEAWFGGDCTNHFGATLPGDVEQGDSDGEKYQHFASRYLNTIVYNMRAKSGWGSLDAPGNMGPCSGKYGLFGRRGEGDMGFKNPILTLQDALITGRYCIPRYDFHNVKKYVKDKYSSTAFPSGNFLEALITEVGTRDMCEIGSLMGDKITYDWDNSGLRGLVNACKSSPWACLEYTADAISFIALWFGPKGWVVSAIFGFISIYSMIKQGKYGWAIVAGAFECFGILMIIKHVKTVKTLVGYGDDTIEAGIKYFDNPTDEAFDLLSYEAKQVVIEMRKSKHTIKGIMKTVNKNEIKHVIQAVSTEREFIELVKLGTVKGLDDIGWQEFKGLQKSIRNSDRAVKKIYNGIKTVTTYTIALGGGYLVSKFLADKINLVVFKDIINNTRDIISEEKTRIQRAAQYTGTINYSVNTILAQDPPFDTNGVTRVHNGADVNAIKDSNTQLTAHDYTEALQVGEEEYASSTGLLLLTKVWRDKTTYPPITPAATTCVYRSPSTDIELDEVVNPGGGWRPNLNCLKDYQISEVAAQAENTIVIKEFEELLHQVKEKEIEETEAKREVGILLNLDQVEYEKIDFSVIDTADYVIY